MSLEISAPEEQWLDTVDSYENHLFTQTPFGWEFAVLETRIGIVDCFGNDTPVKPRTFLTSWPIFSGYNFV